ncbi:unnamed protein product [Heterosigma akashiwo]
MDLAEDATETVSILVDGMMCMKSCGSTVRNALENTPGAIMVSVELMEPNKGKATIEYSTDDFSAPDRFASAVEAVGFGAEIIGQLPTGAKMAANSTWSLKLRE